MTVNELSVLTNSDIKIKDAKDGKILCHRYRSPNHDHLANREVLAIWAEIDVFNSGYSSTAKAIIFVYVEHID